jgi:Ca2+-binding EF-hand superfamily protein
LLAREVGAIIRSLNIYPTEEQFHGWLKEMEEEEPTGYITYDRFEKVAIRLLQEGSLTRDDDEKIFRAFKTLYLIN